MTTVLRMPANSARRSALTCNNAFITIALIRCWQPTFGSGKASFGRSAICNWLSSNGMAWCTTIWGRIVICCTAVASAISEPNGSTSLDPAQRRSPLLKPNWKKSDRFSTPTSQWRDFGAGSDECLSSGDDDAGLVTDWTNPLRLGDAPTRLLAFLWCVGCPERTGGGVGFTQVG